MFTETIHILQYFLFSLLLLSRIYLSFRSWTCFHIVSFNCPSSLITKLNLELYLLLSCALCLYYAVLIMMQIGVLEDTRNRTLHGILRVQSCFRGYQARCLRKELWRGITTLQSCISFTPPNSFDLSYSLWSVCNRLKTFFYPFVQWLEERKAERSLQLCFRDIELLLLYRSTWKQYIKVKEWKIPLMLHLSYSHVWTFNSRNAKIF